MVDKSIYTMTYDEIIEDNRIEEYIEATYDNIAKRYLANGKFLAWTNRVSDLNRQAKQVLGAFLLSVCNYFRQSSDYEVVACIGDADDVKAKLEALSELAGYEEIINGVKHEGDNFPPVIFSMVENLGGRQPVAVIDFNAFTPEDIKQACFCLVIKSTLFKHNAPIKKLAFMVLKEMYLNERDGVAVHDLKVIERVFKLADIIGVNDYLFG